MPKDKSGAFHEDTKKKELAHRLQAPFEDQRDANATDGTQLPSQKKFGGKFISEEPDEDARIRMKAQFAQDEKALGQTMISDKDYDYFIKKKKQERYLKSLQFYDRIFDLKDPYQVRHVVKRVGEFQK